MAYTRKNTAAGWVSENPTLMAGQVGIERDTKKSKVGDGITPWNNLSYRFDMVTADSRYALKSALLTLVGPALTEDPADLGTYLIADNRVTEDPADPGTFLIGV